MRRYIGHALINQTAGNRQAFIRQRLVKANYHVISALLQRVRQRKASLLNRCQKLRCTQHKKAGARLVFAHPVRQRIRGNQDIFTRYRHTQAVHLLHIMLMAARGIIRQQVILTPCSLQFIKKALHTGNQLITKVNRSVHIKKKTLYLRQALVIVGHFLSSKVYISVLYNIFADCATRCAEM